MPPLKVNALAVNLESLFACKEKVVSSHVPCRAATKDHELDQGGGKGA